MRILFLTLGLPFGTHGGAKMRNRGLIRGVAADHEVHILCLSWRGEVLQHLEVNRRECASVTPVENHRTNGEIIRTALQGLLTRRPLGVAPYFLREAAEKLHRFLSENEVDLIVLEESMVAPYMEAIPRNYRGRVIIDFHNIVADQYRTMTHLTSTDWKEKLLYFRNTILMRNWEARFARRADHCIVVSEQEVKRLRKIAPRVPISVVPNGTDIAAPLGPPQVRNTLLFVGMIAYQPNADAVRFFCSSILPRIQKTTPEVKLHVVGLYPPADIRALGAVALDGQRASSPAAGKIVVTGEVADVRPYYENVNIAVVPLRAGGGTRLKILEAMSLGRPVVSTSLGCEGLDVKHREHLMIADHPDDFADRVLELLENPELGLRLSQRARKVVESRYDWLQLGAHFARICTETVGSTPSIAGRLSDSAAPDLIPVYSYSRQDSRSSVPKDR